MRFGLAAAGDGVEDANFVDDMTDNGIRRLHGFLEFARVRLAVWLSVYLFSVLLSLSLSVCLSVSVCLSLCLAV
jgi:hypothetical protein